MNYAKYLISKQMLPVLNLYAIVIRRTYLCVEQVRDGRQELEEIEIIELIDYKQLLTDIGLDIAADSELCQLIIRGLAFGRALDRAIEQHLPFDLCLQAEVQNAQEALDHGSLARDFLGLVDELKPMAQFIKAQVPAIKAEDGDEHDVTLAVLDLLLSVIARLHMYCRQEDVATA